MPFEIAGIFFFGLGLPGLLILGQPWVMIVYAVLGCNFIRWGWRTFRQGLSHKTRPRPNLALGLTMALFLGTMIFIFADANLCREKRTFDIVSALDTQCHNDPYQDTVCDGSGDDLLLDHPLASPIAYIIGGIFGFPLGLFGSLLFPVKGQIAASTEFAPQKAEADDTLF